MLRREEECSIRSCRRSTYVRLRRTDGRIYRNTYVRSYRPTALRPTFIRSSVHYESAPTERMSKPSDLRELYTVSIHRRVGRSVDRPDRTKSNSLGVIQYAIRSTERNRSTAASDNEISIDVGSTDARVRDRLRPSLNKLFSFSIDVRNNIYFALFVRSGKPQFDENIVRIGLTYDMLRDGAAAIATKERSDHYNDREGSQNSCFCQVPSSIAFVIDARCQPLVLLRIASMRACPN